MADPGITVTGVGEVRRRPTVAFVRIGVSVTRPTARQATTDANASASAVLAALASHGVGRDAVQTTTLSLAQSHEHVPPEPPRSVGYTFTNVLSAELADVDTVGTVIDDALAAGADDAVLDGISFGTRDSADTLAEARAAAYRDAHDKAVQLASLAGVTVGAAIAIDESGAGGPAREMGMARFAMSADAVAIMAGQLTATVHLTVRFAIDR